MLWRRFFFIAPTGLIARVALLGVAGGCASAAGASRDPIELQLPVPAAEDSARTAHLVDAASAAGLQPLIAGPPASAQREVRIWIDGYLLPWRLARFVVRRDRVEGALYYHWELPEFYRRGQIRDGDIAPGAEAERLGPGCATPPRVTGIAVACQLRLERATNWAALLGSLEGEDLWTLPDPSALPRDGVHVTDGVGITVELATEGGYRSYRYGNPHAHTTWPSAAKADRILRRVQSAFPSPR